MAITDNSFTPEELGTALTTNPDLLNSVRSVLTDAHKLHVQTEAERADLLRNHEATVVSAKTREHAAAIEKDVFELTGIPKKDAEKYYDYQKRAVKEKLGSLETLQTELDDLKAQGGNVSSADKARITQLEKALGEKETTWKTKYTELESTLNTERASNSIQAGLADFRTKYKADIDPKLVKLAEDAVTKDLLSKAKFQEADGKSTLTFLDEKGDVMLNKSTFKPMTAAEILAESDTLKVLIDEGKQQTGTGTNAAQQQQQQGKPGDTKYTGVPSTVKTRVQLTEYVLGLGILDGSAEYTKIMNEDGSKLPLR